MTIEEYRASLYRLKSELSDLLEKAGTHQNPTLKLSYDSSSLEECYLHRHSSALLSEAYSLYSEIGANLEPHRVEGIIERHSNHCYYIGKYRLYEGYCIRVYTGDTWITGEIQRAGDSYYLNELSDDTELTGLKAQILTRA